MSFYTRYIFHIIISITLVNYAAGFEAEKDVFFELYTREEPRNYFLLKPSDGDSISQTTFKTTRPTRIFVHGYRSKRKVIERYAEGFLSIGDFNFIAVNWQEGSSTVNYYSAKRRVKQVSQVLAKLIDYLIEKGMNMKDLVMVGHSLGAHTVGRAAKQIKSTERVPVIIGLDPASVFFDFDRTDKRLADTDAEYVQVIHTDSGHLSIEYPMGHADFYPNKGAKQPGCPLRNYFTNLIEKCSHTRSHAYYLESLFTPFPSIQCVSYEEIKQNRCTHSGVIAMMGGNINHTSEKPQGIFYLETNVNPPYAKPKVDEFSNVQLVTYNN